jgi:hypothetical protein
LKDEPISESVSFLSFFLAHKDNRGTFDPKLSKDLTNFHLELIDLLFVELFIDQDEVHSDLLPKPVPPKIANNLVLLLFKERHQVLLEILKEKLLKKRQKWRINRNDPSGRLFFNAQDSCFI